jgi:predicted secreted protein
MPAGCDESCTSEAIPEREEDVMGDKSPKSKQRDQKQKDATKAKGAANLKAKQDSHSHAPPPSFVKR